jgi:hypothetical protein
VPYRSVEPPTAILPMKTLLLCLYLGLYPFLADGLRLSFESYIRQVCNESSMNFE